MTWGGGQTGPETGVGGLNRANLVRIHSSEDGMIREAEGDRRNDSDENDDESIKNRNREVFLGKLTIIIILALFFGLVVYLAVFVAH